MSLALGISMWKRVGKEAWCGFAQDLPRPRFDGTPRRSLRSASHKAESGWHDNLKIPLKNIKTDKCYNYF